MCCLTRFDLPRIPQIPFILLQLFPVGGDEDPVGGLTLSSVGRVDRLQRPTESGGENIYA